MFKFGLRAGLAVGAILATVFVLLPATAAMATATNCGGGSAIQECTTINGSGLHINYMQGWAVNLQDYVVSQVHVQLTGPNGSIKSCAAVRLAAGGKTPVCQWSPNANEVGGKYCTTGWWEEYAGDYVNMGTECVNVS